IRKFGQENQITVGIERQDMCAENTGVRQRDDRADVAGADFKIVAISSNQAQIASVAGGENAVVIRPAGVGTGEVAEEGDLAVFVDDRIGENAEFNAFFGARRVLAGGGDELWVVGIAGVNSER